MRVLIPLLLASATAHADDTVPPAAPATHTGKLFLRVHLGPAYTHMSSDVKTLNGGTTDLTISGAGGAFGLAIGASVTEELVVFGEVFDDIAASPEIKLGSASGDTSSDTSAGVVGLGAGLAYYFPGPTNMYVSGTLALAKLTVQDDGMEVGETDIGPAISVMLGKSWPVSPTWNLGVSGQLSLARMSDKDDGPAFTSKGVAVVFAASYR